MFDFITFSTCRSTSDLPHITKFTTSKLGNIFIKLPTNGLIGIIFKRLKSTLIDDLERLFA